MVMNISTLEKLNISLYGIALAIGLPATIRAGMHPPGMGSEIVLNVVL